MTYRAIREIKEEVNWMNKKKLSLFLHLSQFEKESHFECQIFYFTSNFASALLLFATHIHTPHWDALSLSCSYLYLSVLWPFVSIYLLRSTWHPIFNMIFRYIETYILAIFVCTDIRGNAIELHRSALHCIATFTWSMCMLNMCIHANVAFGFHCLFCL